MILHTPSKHPRAVLHPCSKGRFMPINDLYGSGSVKRGGGTLLGEAWKHRVRQVGDVGFVSAAPVPNPPNTPAQSESKRQQLRTRGR